MKTIALLRRRSVAVAMLIVAGAGALMFWFNRAPRYEGKTAAYWVNQLVRNQTGAQRALRELGPAAVPSLAMAVDRKQSWLEKRIEPLRSKLPRWISRHLHNSYEAELRGERAIQILYELGAVAAPAIPALLRHENDPSLMSSVMFYPISPGQVILNVGVAGVPQLTEALERDGAPVVRCKAAGYLGSFGANAETAASALGRALNDANATVRNAAVTALAQIGPPASTALPALHAALRLDDDYFRLRVIDALWQIGHESESTLPILMRILSDRNNPNRAHAATLLAKMGPTAKPALNALINVLREDFSYTRVKAEEAVRQIAPELLSKTAGNP